MACRTAATGAPTAVASETRLCGSSTISRIASSRRATSVAFAAAVWVCASRLGAPGPAPVGASAVIVGSQRSEGLGGPVLGSPAQGELAQRLHLLERDGRVPVQLEDGQES